MEKRVASAARRVNCWKCNEEKMVDSVISTDVVFATALMITDGQHTWVNPKAKAIVGSTDPKLVEEFAPGALGIEMRGGRQLTVMIDGRGPANGAEAMGFKHLLGLMNVAGQFVRGGAEWLSDADAPVTESLIAAIKAHLTCPDDEDKEALLH